MRERWGVINCDDFDKTVSDGTLSAGSRFSRGEVMPSQSVAVPPPEQKFRWGEVGLPLEFTITQQGENYYAYLKDCTQVAGCGPTKEAALGDLILRGQLLYPNILPINVEFD